MRQQGYPMMGIAPFPTPEYCEVCGRPLTTSAMDLVTQLARMSEPLVEGLRTMFGSWQRPMGYGPRPAWGPGPYEPRPYGKYGRGPGGGHGYGYGPGHRGKYGHGHHHGHDCCPDCGRDDCHCRCCVTDADLLVYARLGERRVVPVVVRNRFRREREVKLELSGWSTGGGKPAEHIKATVAPVTQFTLGPCEDRDVIIVVNVGAEQAGVVGAVPGDAPPATNVPPAERRKLPDVDDCEVYYADLRVEGCQIRPVRIALAVLPRDCAAYEIDCRHECC